MKRLRETPRTDAVLNTFNGKASKLAADLATHAEELERELAETYAKLDRILKLTIHDDTFWAIEEIARISGGESDSLPNVQGEARADAAAPLPPTTL